MSLMKSGSNHVRLIRDILEDAPGIRHFVFKDCRRGFSSPTTVNYGIDDRQLVFKNKYNGVTNLIA